MRYTSEFLTDVYLISAYDVAKGHIPPPEELLKPELIILDSGGYEVAGIDRPSPNSEDFADWAPDEQRAVLAAWPDDVPAVFVSYDHPLQILPLDRQISNARKQKADFGRQLHCFLIKPERKEEKYSLKGVLSNAVVKANQLSGFDVIGITEKGLGNSPIDRMIQIAKFRRALDEAKCPAPIHVFGSLDPVSTCLYYIAGAEIFDGLTWLRYSFAENLCVYPWGYGPIANGLHVKDVANRSLMLSDNYFKIKTLQENLQKFARTGNFDLLPHSKFLKDADEDLWSRFDL